MLGQCHCLIGRNIVTKILLQRSQFTSHLFTSRLEEVGVQISMDGRGRAFDNIFIERLWRTLKYEDIYVKDYQTVMMLKKGLEKYFEFYNTERLHQSLNYSKVTGAG
jgi:putative transposase